MNITDQTLNAYIDDELDNESKQALERELQFNAELQQKLSNLKKVNKALSISFPLDKNIPERLINTVRNYPHSSNVTSIETRKTNRATEKISKNWYPTAIAASITLVLGALLSSYFIPSSFNNEDILLSTTIKPNNALFEILENNLSSSEAEINTSSNQQIVVNPILSFKDKKGNYCREFDIAVEGSISIGIACRVSDTRWNMEVLLHTDKVAGPAQTYSLASGYDENTIESVIDRLMVGDPILPEKEKLLIDNNWK